MVRSDPKHGVYVEGRQLATDAVSTVTDDATVNNAPTSDNDALRWQEGVETGSVTADGVDNSTGNNDWGQAATTNKSVTFSNAFSGTPAVVITDNRGLDNVANHEYKCDVGNESTTGFDVTFRQMSADDRSGTTDAYGTEYIAAEGR